MNPAKIEKLAPEIVGVYTDAYLNHPSGATKDGAPRESISKHVAGLIAVFEFANKQLRAALSEQPEGNNEVIRLRAALVRIAEHYTDTALAAKHMSAHARMILSPTGDSCDYVWSKKQSNAAPNNAETKEVTVKTFELPRKVPSPIIGWHEDNNAETTQVAPQNPQGDCVPAPVSAPTTGEKTYIAAFDRRKGQRRKGWAHPDSVYHRRAWMRERRQNNAAAAQESTHQAVENAISAAKVKDHKWGESPASAVAPAAPSNLPTDAEQIEYWFQRNNHAERKLTACQEQLQAAQKSVTCQIYGHIIGLKYCENCNLPEEAARRLVQGFRAGLEGDDLLSAARSPQTENCLQIATLQGELLNANDQLAKEREARNALEGDRTELQAKCGHLEQQIKAAEAELPGEPKWLKELDGNTLPDSADRDLILHIYALRAFAIAQVSGRNKLVDAIRPYAEGPCAFSKAPGVRAVCFCLSCVMRAALAAEGEKREPR